MKTSINQSVPPGRRLIPLSRAEPHRNAIARSIASHPFLHGLKPAHVQLLAENAMRMRYGAGEFIFRTGEPANRFYLIEEGRVSLEAPRSEPVEGLRGGARSAQLQIIGPGDVLGWSWLFPPYTWQFDARTLAPTEAIFFYGTRLREQCEQEPDFGFEMLKRVTQLAMQRRQWTRQQVLLQKQRSLSLGANFYP